MTQQTFIFIGRSGCGKGTQAKLLTDYLKKIDPKKDVLYIYTGDQFREFIKGKSETQKLSKVVYEAGGIEPEFLAIYMWVNVLVEKYTKNEHLIFDGTPRKYHEAGALDSIINFYDLEKPFVININISKEESIKRLLGRGRIDDNKEDIEKRLLWYETDVLQAIGYYKDNLDYHFLQINGEHSIEEIHKDIISEINLQ